MTEGGSPSKYARFLHLTKLLTLIVLAFSYGFGVGGYHWPPFSVILDAKRALFRVPAAGAATDYHGEEEILRLAFTDPLIPGEQLYKPITSLDGISKANQSLRLPVQHFYDAYKYLEVVDASPITLDRGATKILALTYRLADKTYNAYAYSIESRGTRMAAVIIPGSGFNQSSGIYKNDPSNYHFGIMDALGNSFDKFVFIKPNEDCIAFHNGKAKLNNNFIINSLLHRGASYSAHYLVGSLAVTKYLQAKYDKVIVVGLSQGGFATLLNSLQSQPHAAIIASGFSVIDDRVEWAGYDQIIIPGLRNRLSLGVIRPTIQQSTTRFLITFGRREEGTYKIEAEERQTCEYLSSAQNVECRTHSGGHVFPKDIIIEFLSKHT